MGPSGALNGEMFRDYADVYRNMPAGKGPASVSRDGSQPQFSAMLTYLDGMFFRSVAWANPGRQVEEE